MKTITDDDGNVYVLKSDMESVIKERIAKVSARAQQAEEQVRTLQTDLDAAKQSAGTSDVLAQLNCQMLLSQLQSWQMMLSQKTKSMLILLVMDLRKMVLVLLR